MVFLASACGNGSVNNATPTGPTDTVATAETAAEAVNSWPHDWREELVGGGQFDAGDYAGQDLVLWFWAPW